MSQNDVMKRPIKTASRGEKNFLKSMLLKKKKKKKKTSQIFGSMRKASGNQLTDKTRQKQRENRMGY